MITFQLLPGRNITPCENGTREENGECKLCIPTAGEYQDKEGKNYCERIKPGYAARERYEGTYYLRQKSFEPYSSCSEFSASNKSYFLIRD